MEGGDNSGLLANEEGGGLMKHHEISTRLKGERHVSSTDGMDDHTHFCCYTDFHSLETERNERSHSG